MQFRLLGPLQIVVDGDGRPRTHRWRCLHHPGHAKLTVALLNRTAPGMAALDPIGAADDPASRIGVLWEASRQDDGRIITQKNGKTAGYSSYLALDRTRRRGVIVLADVDRGVDELGQQLLLGNP